MTIRSRTHDGRPEGCSHRTTSALVCSTRPTCPPLLSRDAFTTDPRRVRYGTATPTRRNRDA
jgi:hypothetical protein